jgi:uncharacterized caspase-like protein
MRILVAAACVLMLVFAGTEASHAEVRIALVIGNRDYNPGVGPLMNPLNDIRLVGDALKSVGFTVLDPVKNATRAEMLRAIYTFASALKAAGPDAVGFLYYSGHGVASGGENYLVPIDVSEPSSLQLSIQGVKQSEILEILRDEAPNAAHYLVFDACRNNLQGARGGKGFIAVGQQSGVLIAFSTEPGRTALDGGTGSGPYAAALAAELLKPGQNDLLMFHNIRVDVMDKTNGDQVPWTEDGIERRERPVFARVAAGSDQLTKPSPVGATQNSGQPSIVSIESGVAESSVTPKIDIREDYQLALQLGTREGWDAFLGRYHDGFYAELAKGQLKKISAEEARVAAAEKARLAAAEQQRIAAEGANSSEQAKAAEKTRIAEEDRLAAEKNEAIENAKVQNGGRMDEEQRPRTREEEAEEERSYKQAQSNIDLLKTYAQNCRICAYKTIALQEAERLGDEAKLFMLKVCNKSPRNASVAVMGRTAVKNDEWHVQGWWNVHSGQCSNIKRYVKGNIYLFAQEDGNASFAWKGKDLPLCVEVPGPFDRVNREDYNCHSPEKTVTFSAFSVSDPTFTWNLNPLN